MDTIAPLTPARPAELRHRRVRLELGPAAAAHACGYVRATISAWSVPVNPAVAILLTSDLVINAVTNGADETITLGIRWSSGQFRVEVHDASVKGDSWETADASVNAERGLLLAAAMAADWGHYRTPAGRAVYYVLASEPQVNTVVARGDDPPGEHSNFASEQGSYPSEAGKIRAFDPPAALPRDIGPGIAPATDDRPTADDPPYPPTVPPTWPDGASRRLIGSPLRDETPRGDDSSYSPVVPPTWPDGASRRLIGFAKRDEASQGGAASPFLGPARGLPPREAASGDGES